MDNDETIWERGWDGHNRAQALRLARLPLWEKLAWLEEADQIVRHLSATGASGRKPPLS